MYGMAMVSWVWPVSGSSVSGSSVFWSQSGFWLPGHVLLFYKTIET